VFGIGAQEMVVIGLLLLIVSGPSKLPGMARDFGRFVSEARRSVEEFREDLASEEEYDRESRENPDLETSRELEENDGHEEGAVVTRSLPPTPGS